MEVLSPERFKDQVALVTGAAEGIGRTIARRLALEGARIAMVDLNASAAQEAAEAIKRESGHDTLAIAGNVADEADVKRAVDHAVQRLGRLDILVNNAGIGGKAGPIWEQAAEDLDRIYQVNLRGPFLCCKYALEVMRRAGYGRIVNIASIAGKEGNPGMIPYSATKAALIGLTKALGKELAETKITVNAVTPAVIRTRILDQLTPEQVKYMTDRIPMKRTGTAEEVAALVAFLASRECSFSTGAVFDISGGRATY